MGEIRDELATTEQTYGLSVGAGLPARERFTRLVSMVRRSALREAQARRSGAGDEAPGVPSRGELIEFRQRIGAALGVRAGADLVRHDMPQMVRAYREQSMRWARELDVLTRKITEHAAILYPGKLAQGADVASHCLAVEAMGVDLAALRRAGERVTFSADGNALVEWAEHEWSVTPADGASLRARLSAVLAEVERRVRGEAGPLPIEGQGPLVHHLTTRMAGAVSELRKVVPDGLAETVPPLATPAEIPNHLDAAVAEIVARHGDVDERATRDRRRAQRYRARLDELYNRLERDVAGDYLRAGLGLGSLAETVAYLIACGPVALKGAPVVYPPTPNVDGSPVGGFRPRAGGAMVEVCGAEGPNLGDAALLRCLRGPGHRGEHVGLTDDEEPTRIVWGPVSPRPGQTVEVIEQFAQLDEGTILRYRQHAHVDMAAGNRFRSSDRRPLVLVADHPHEQDGEPRWSMDGNAQVYTDADLVRAVEFGEFEVVALPIGVTP